MNLDAAIEVAAEAAWKRHYGDHPSQARYFDNNSWETRPEFVKNLWRKRARPCVEGLYAAGWLNEPL